MIHCQREGNNDKAKFKYIKYQNNLFSPLGQEYKNIQQTLNHTLQSLSRGCHTLDLGTNKHWNADDRH